MTDPRVYLIDKGEYVDATTYLKGVVPSEAFPSWPEETLRALCVAAASYAASKGWRVYSDTRDQVYNPQRRTARTDKIVEEMAGVLAYYNGAPARLFYSARCGGQTEADWAPYLATARCFCGRSRHGHGRGLCQYGAAELGKRGYTWDQILNWYYRGLSFRCGWGAAPLYDRAAPPECRIGLHIQRADYPAWLRKSLADAADMVTYVVCIDPPMDATPFPGQRVLARIWIGGDMLEQQMIDRGAEGARYYWQMIRERIPRYAYAVLGPNEPRVETREDRQNLVAFYEELTTLAAAAGALVAGPSIGVGRMGNDTALQAAGWDWLQQMPVWAHDMAPLYRRVALATDHAYGRRNGALWEHWDDWTLRMAHILYHLPWQIRRDIEWVCTEGGLDIAGGEHDGWRGPGGPGEEQYIEQLCEVNRRLPPEVTGYCLFTALPERRWSSFEITESLWSKLLARLRPGHPSEHETTIRRLARENRWHQEEAIREIERGDAQAARQRLLDNIAMRAYPLEMWARGSNE